MLLSEFPLDFPQERLHRREQQFAPFGLRQDHTEWLALVCLHSGIFTRAQFCAHFGCRLRNRGWAVEESLDGLPTTTRPCRIAHPQPYRRAETILHRWTHPSPEAEYQPLTPQEKEEIRRIEQAVHETLRHGEHTGDIHSDNALSTQEFTDQVCAHVD